MNLVAVFVALVSGRRSRRCSGSSGRCNTSAALPSPTFQRRWDVKAFCNHSNPFLCQMLDHDNAHDPTSKGRRNIQTHVAKRGNVFARCWMTALLTIEITSPLMLFLRAFVRLQSKPLSSLNELVNPPIWLIAWL